MITNNSTIQLIATTLFAVAVLHTFLAFYFEKLAHQSPNHSGLFHLLGEVEVVFGFWAMVLIVSIAMLAGTSNAIQYAESRNYTEPLFVFVVMVIAASKPILFMAKQVVLVVSKLLSVGFKLKNNTANYFVTLSFVPILGSLITEPAAMTLAALLLRDTVFTKTKSSKLMYLTLGVLFVNISIGGALTSFAAPPILMVTAAWGWDTAYVFQTFGIKAAIAVFVNAFLLTLFVHKELPQLSSIHNKEDMPLWVVATHMSFLIGVVIFAHHPVIFMGLLLFFIGYTYAYSAYQSKLILKEALLVAFFLAGLVVLGGLQQWWLQPLLTGMSNTAVFYGATLLTAITDNAALTYLGSLVEGTTEEFRYALVAGALTGGGLTVIANAPNPAGLAILKESFPNKAVSALKLFASALPPTLVSIVAFRFF
jgi:hypothetical protein